MTADAEISPTLWVKVRSGLEAVVISTSVAAVVGAVSTALLYWVTAPDCNTSTEWLCGLGEALLALAVGSALGLGTYVWIALRMLRRSLPPGNRALTIAAVIVGFPGLLVLVRTLGGLVGY